MYVSLVSHEIGMKTSDRLSHAYDCQAGNMHASSMPCDWQMRNSSIRFVPCEWKAGKYAYFTHTVSMNVGAHARATDAPRMKSEEHVLMTHDEWTTSGTHVRVVSR